MALAVRREPQQAQLAQKMGQELSPEAEEAAPAIEAQHAEAER